MKKILFIINFFIISSAAESASVIKEFRGSESLTTPIFLVEAPWLLDWRLDGDYDELIALDITLIEAATGRHVGRVLHTKQKGNGLKLFDHSGRYQLRVSSTLARWTLKIKQIKPEEKELYSRKESKLKKNNPFR
tara:strand:+ start:194 stop:598 length:405 start_codon:yes stop_codon:yes gene_type:complete